METNESVGMNRFMLLAIVAFACTACVSAGQGQVRHTRDSLNRLELGMNKRSVLDIMGAPRIREVFMDSDEKGVEVLFYQTEFVGMAITPRQKDLTPILLKENRVIGWGRNFYESRLKIDVHIADRCSDGTEWAVEP
jgi:hypothetical protein